MCVAAAEACASLELQVRCFSGCVIIMLRNIAQKQQTQTYKKMYVIYVTDDFNAIISIIIIITSPTISTVSCLVTFVPNRKK